MTRGTRDGPQAIEAEKARPPRLLVVASRRLAGGWARRSPVVPCGRPERQLPRSKPKRWATCSSSWNGKRRVWLPDAADAKRQVIRFDADLTERQAIGGVHSITGDDIAVGGRGPGLGPAGALLTRIDASQVTETHMAGYLSEDRLTRDEGTLNKRWSELAVADSFAWLTDPSHDAVQKLRFVG